jgi:choline dehydrogenase
MRAVRRAMKLGLRAAEAGAGAVGRGSSLAALLGRRGRRQGQDRCVVVATGGNVSLADFIEAYRTMLEADYVIVGSGSAGSALAYRLSEDGKHSVIVIEYGGTDFGPLIQMPSALSIPMNMSRYDWGFCQRAGAASRRPRARHAARQGARRLVLDQRHGLCPRPRARLRPLGGGRAPPAGPIADVLPYFKRMEHSNGGEEGWRGTSGPLQRAAWHPRKNPLYQAFVEAGRQAGFELTEDYNGAKQEGFGAMEQTIHGGRRWSVANAYLRPALKRGKTSVSSMASPGAW